MWGCLRNLIVGPLSTVNESKQLGPAAFEALRFSLIFNLIRFKVVGALFV